MKSIITGRIVSCTYIERHFAFLWMIGNTYDLEYYHNEIVGLYGLLI